MTSRAACAATLLLAFIAGCTSGPPVGAAAPSFSAADADGNTVSLAAHEGHVLILDFWAVW